MARRRKHEEHANHEAWAIPYGDLITLLLAFFVVMYAISSVNEGKYRVLSDSLSAAFSGTPRTLEPIQAGHRALSASRSIAVSPVARAGRDGEPRTLLEQIPVPATLGAQSSAGPLDAAELEAAARRLAAEQARREQLDTLASGVEQAMSGLIEAGQLSVRRHGDWIEVEIRTDLLYSSGSADLGRAAIDAIEQLATTLRDGANPIRVEGHTDDVPIRTAAFPSNWELSAARAAGVVRILAGRGVEPGRLAVLGMGQFRPVQSNATAAGRLANRRVLLVISAEPDQPADESNVVPDGGVVASVTN